MRRASKSGKIVSDAKSLSDDLIRQIPEDSAKTRANAQKIVTICSEFVLAEPAVEVIAHRVSEVGRARYGQFPAEQSLLNRYAKILRVWRNAYHKIIDVRHFPRGDSSGSGDSQPYSRVSFELVHAMLREQKAENDRLKRIIEETVPICPADPENRSIGLMPSEIGALRLWLETVGHPGGPLEITPSGLAISRRAMPGIVVVPDDVFKCLTAVLAVFDLRVSSN
jgi:hypothetical protein